MVATIGEGEKILVAIDTADAAGGGGTDPVVATAEHPFWTGPIDGWVQADDLTPGTWLRTGSGTCIRVTAVEARTAQQRVHNLTIDVGTDQRQESGDVVAATANETLNLRHEAGVVEHVDGRAFAVVALAGSRIPAVRRPEAEVLMARVARFLRDHLRW